MISYFLPIVKDNKGNCNKKGSARWYWFETVVNNSEFSILFSQKEKI